MSFDAVMPPYNASDPTASFLGSSCLDLLLIELVPMAYRVVNELDGQAAASDSAAGTGPGAQQLPTPPPEDRHQSSSRTNGADSAPAAAASGAGDAAARRAAGGGGVVGRMDEEEERDAVFFRLEALGYRVGQGLVERFSRDRPKFTDTLDVIKFLCKDLWMLVFRKQVDNLKTNHRVSMMGRHPGTIYGFFRVAAAMAFSKKQTNHGDTNELTMGGESPGSLRADGQLVPAVLEDEHRGRRAGGAEGATGVYTSGPPPYTHVGSNDMLTREAKFLWFPCGIVRGALAALGITATVQAETNELPAAMFQIKTIPAKA